MLLSRLLILSITIQASRSKSSGLNSLDNFELEGSHVASRFQTLFRNHNSQSQFHDQAIAIISALKLPESCLYSSLTEKLIGRCSSSTVGIDGFEKTTFATKLAICEFKAAGVSYPKDCRDELNHEWEIRKCVKKLESKPQWWTSWSNCLQSIGVMCQAVRAEADRDNLLNLHLNLTGLHFRQQNQLQTSLWDTEAHLEAQRASSQQARSVMLGVNEDMLRVKEQILNNMQDLFVQGKIQTARLHKDTLEGVSNVLSQVIQASAKADDHLTAMNSLSGVLTNITQVWQGIFTDIEQQASKHREGTIAIHNEISECIKSSSLSAETEISQLTNTVFASLQNLSLSVTTLQRMVSQTSNMLYELSEEAHDFRTSHEDLQISMELQQNNQKDSLSVMNQMTAQINETLVRIIERAEEVLVRLDDTEERLAGNNSSRSLASWACWPLILSGAAMISKRWLGLVLLVIGIVICLWTSLDFDVYLQAFFQYLQHTQILEHGYFIDAPIHVEQHIANSTSYFRGFIEFMRPVWRIQR